MRSGLYPLPFSDRSVVTDFDIPRNFDLSQKEITATNNFLHPAPLNSGILNVNYTYQANAIKAMPFIPQKDMLVNTVQYRHASAGTAGKTARILIYTSTLKRTNNGIVSGTVSPEFAYPDLLIADGGTKAVDVATTTLNWAFNTILYRNQLYFICWWSNDTTGLGRTTSGFFPMLGYETGVASPDAIIGFTNSVTYGNPPSRYPVGGSVIVAGTPTLVLFAGGYYL